MPRQTGALIARAGESLYNASLKTFPHDSVSVSKMLYTMGSVAMDSGAGREA